MNGGPLRQEFDGIGELAKDFCHAQIGACSAQQLDGAAAWRAALPVLGRAQAGRPADRSSGVCSAGIDWEAVRAEGKAKAKPKAAKPAGPVCRCASPGRRAWRVCSVDSRELGAHICRSNRCGGPKCGTST